MVTLSFDSSTLISVMRRDNARVVEAFTALDVGRTSAMVSVVVLHELWSGADLGANPAGEREKIELVLREFGIAALEAEDVERSARVRAQLRQQGRSIGDLDTLIAGQALARGWTVVTRNVKHFGRVEGLPLVDWNLGPELLTEAEIAARLVEA